MPLMGSLYIGNSALQTNQNSLNATAHNMANSDTVGYVRQQAYNTTNTYNTLKINADSVSNFEVGTGVVYAETRQIRDYFLDLSYRRESGRSAFYETSFSAMEEVEIILGELNQVAFQQSLEDLVGSVQELSKEPAGSVQQGLFIQSCNAFLMRSKSVYEGLCNYQDNTNTNIKLMVDKINDYGKQIKTLNDHIRYIETAGIEQANDLRDARAQLVDELSGMGKIEVQELETGAITVKFEGENFVQDDVAYEIGVKTDSTTGFYTPFWTQNTPYTLSDTGEKVYDPSKTGKVFDIEQLISTENNTDIGQLKAMIFTRGEKRGDYTDLINEEKYDAQISQSVIVNIQAEFDGLVNAVTTMINDVVKRNTAEGFEVFTRISGYTGAPEEGQNPGVGVITDTLYATHNLQMNQELVEQPTKLKFRNEADGEAFAALEELKKGFEAEDYRLNPNVLNKTNIMKYYDALVGQISNSGNVYKNIADHQSDVVSATEYQRQSILGVSTEEELSNMVRFQNGYNAASRYINVISEMLEHLINKLG